MKEYLLKLQSKVSTLFQEISQDPLAWSMMRVLSFIAVVFPLLIWGYICISKLEVVDIPWGVVGIITVGITGKILQKQIESKNEIELNKQSNSEEV